MVEGSRGVVVGGGNARQQGNDSRHMKAGNGRTVRAYVRGGSSGEVRNKVAGATRGHEELHARR